jgi:hypothetical protein
MSAPRDADFGVVTPVDFMTGVNITAHHAARQQAVDKAVRELYVAMHDAEGSAAPDGPLSKQRHRFQTRRMAIANTHIETALLFIHAAIMDPE